MEKRTQRSVAKFIQLYKNFPSYVLRKIASTSNHPVKYLRFVVDDKKLEARDLCFFGHLFGTLGERFATNLYFQCSSTIYREKSRMKMLDNDCARTYNKFPLPSPAHAHRQMS